MDLKDFGQARNGILSDLDRPAESCKTNYVSFYMVKVPGSNKNRLVNGNLIKNVGQFFGHFQIEKIETVKKILATPPSPNLNL